MILSIKDSSLPSDMHTLPNELHCEILKHLPREKAKAVSRVCALWCFLNKIILNGVNFTEEEVCYDVEIIKKNRRKVRIQGMEAIVHNFTDRKISVGGYGTRLELPPKVSLFACTDFTHCDITVDKCNKKLGTFKLGGYERTFINEIGESGLKKGLISRTYSLTKEEAEKILTDAFGQTFIFRESAQGENFISCTYKNINNIISNVRFNYNKEKNKLSHDRYEFESQEQVLNYLFTTLSQKK